MGWLIFLSLRWTVCDSRLCSLLSNCPIFCLALWQRPQTERSQQPAFSNNGSNVIAVAGPIANKKGARLWRWSRYVWLVKIFTSLMILRLLFSSLSYSVLVEETNSSKRCCSSRRNSWLLRHIELDHVSFSTSWRTVVNWKTFEAEC